MMIGNHTNNSSPIMNDWANASRWLGICTLLPYLIFAIIDYLDLRLGDIYFQGIFLSSLFCIFWGIVLGPVSFIVGIVGLKQISNSQGIETGRFPAILGMVFGIVGIGANILFWRLLLVAFFSA